MSYFVQYTQRQLSASEAQPYLHASQHNTHLAEIASKNPDEVVRSFILRDEVSGQVLQRPVNITERFHGSSRQAAYGILGLNGESGQAQDARPLSDASLNVYLRPGVSISQVYYGDIDGQAQGQASIQGVENYLQDVLIVYSDGSATLYSGELHIDPEYSY